LGTAIAACSHRWYSDQYAIQSAAGSQNLEHAWEIHSLRSDAASFRWEVWCHGVVLHVCRGSQLGGLGQIGMLARSSATYPPACCRESEGLLVSGWVFWVLPSNSLAASSSRPPSLLSLQRLSLLAAGGLCPTNRGSPSTFGRVCTPAGREGTLCWGGLAANSLSWLRAIWRLPLLCHCRAV
jgi:hypothetical protein